VGESVERAGADRGDAVHQFGVDVMLPGERHEIVTECIERDRHSAGGRAGQPGKRVHGDRERDQRPSPNRQHRVADGHEGGQSPDHSVEADEAADRQQRQDTPAPWTNGHASEVRFN